MKNENLKKIANIILIMGIILTLIGAIYIVIVQQAYAKISKDYNDKNYDDIMPSALQNAEVFLF